MKLCRFQISERLPGSKNHAHIGLLTDGAKVLDLTEAGWPGMTTLLERDDLSAVLASLAKEKLPRHRVSDLKLLPPVEKQEIWAAGVTYLRSKKARMEESDFSANAYDRVYEAARPELFFKSMPEKVVGPGEPVGIRKDAKWNVPEPELALVVNSGGKIAGLTIGNDMSSRDIEGENLLYLPQAKVYNRSCALGPWILVGVPEAEARGWKIELQIRRNGEPVFAGETSVGQIKRSFDELAAFLFRSQDFPHGAALLTGTGIVPPDTFTLRSGDTVRINISGIGTLENSVMEV
ncbi:MAG TPA: fumarylacetoacetate hydrolase family protein [Candidatus Angelobacter sp.]|nr:fumarylacetoacetate hydrolase family protein [Candidatus Angelobacter sp.]